MKTSNLFAINLKDIGKGLFIAVLGAVLGLVQTSIEAGSLHFDWLAIGKGALLAALAYLGKQFLSNNKGQVLTKDIPTP